MKRLFSNILRRVKKHTVNRGTFECFNCLQNTVIWDNDFDFEDYGIDAEGIVHVLHCANCGADIEYYVPCGEQED